MINKPKTTMSLEKRTLGLLFAILLAVVYPASAIGVLKIEAPSSAAVGEEVEIRVINSLTGDPVESVTVYVNGVEVGVTDENGVVGYIFDSPGVYIIGATKFGYTPALDVSISVEEVTTPVVTPAEVPIPTPEEVQTVTVEGAVIPANLVSNAFLDPINCELRRKFGVDSSAFLVNDDVWAVLVGVDLEVGSYRVTGVEKGKVNVHGREYTVIAVETYERLDVQSVDFNTLEDGLDELVGKEVKTHAYLREFPFEVGEGVFVVSIYPGDLSDDGDVPVMDELKDLLESDELNYDGIPTIRLTTPTDQFGNQQAFWKGLFADVRVLVIPSLFAVEILPEKVRKYIGGGDHVLILMSSEINGVRTTVSEIRADPERFYGRVVELEVTGMGVTKSAKELIATVFPPAGASPVNVYLVAYALFELPVKGDNIIPAFAISSYYRALGMEVPDGYYHIKGLVLNLRQLDDRLPNIPILIIFEAERARMDESLQLSEEDRALLQEYVDPVMAYIKGKGSNEHEVHGTPEPHEISEVHESPEPHETHEAPTPTPLEAPTPETSAPLQILTLEISPSSITANPGDTINLKLRVDWEPKDWKGKADIRIVLSAAGFKKEYELPDVVLENPPIEEEFSYTLPADIPPLTYEAKVIVEAGNQKAEDSVQLKVEASGAPGFEVVLGLVGLVGAIVWRRWLY